MNKFKEIIENFEKEKIDGVYLIKKGNIPILLTAPHTMKQLKEDYTIKPSEPYTKAIVKYVCKETRMLLFDKTIRCRNGF